jgi:uncharacterized OB-fold protein
MSEASNKTGQNPWPRPVTKPVGSVETQPFWDACADHTFLVKRCVDCSEAHFYPRATCPFCHSAQVEWEAVSGEGEIYTFTIVRRSATGPYAPGYVQLKEGPRVFTNIVQCDFDALRVGQKVKVVFQPAGDGAFLPMFAPV